MNAILPFVARYWTVAGWTMLHFLWLGSLAWLIAVVLRRAVERSSPTSRSAVSLFAFACFAAIAAGIFVRIATHGGLVETSPTLPPAALPTPVADPEALAARAGGGRRFPSPALDAAGSPAAAAPQDAWTQAVGPAAERAASLLPWVWCLGAPLVALTFVTGVVGTFRLRRGSRPVVDGVILDLLARLQSTLNVGRRVLLAVTEHVTSPIVIGIARPMILLPPSVLSGLSPDQLEMILLHELAHVRRRDNVVNLLQRAIEALLFFHPAVWWASRWVRLEREHCCDALVLAHGRDPQAYAETLASLALPELAPRYAAAAMANHQLVSRIRHILNVEKQPMVTSFRTLVWSGVALVIASVGCFVGLQLGQGRPAQAQEPAAPGQKALLKAVTLDAADETELTDYLQFVDGATLENFDQDGDLYVAEMTDAGQVSGWSPEQATGAPNVPEAGHNPNAWASLTGDGQEEWLLTTFDNPVHAAAVVVYESFNPGAIHKLGVYNESGHETIVWEGTDPVRPVDGKGVSVIPINVTWKTGNVKLYLNSPAVAGWNEIDAVGLLDLATGEVHWAKSAQASSTHAERDADRAGNAGRLAWKYCTDCHAGGHAHYLDQIMSGWRHGRAPVCPECFHPLSAWIDRGEQAGDVESSPADDVAARNRKRAELLRRELKKLEEAIAQQEAEAARQAEAADRPAQETANDYRMRVSDYFRQLGISAEGTPAAAPDPQQTLRELAAALKQQQAVIDKLTQALEDLQTKFGELTPQSRESGEGPDKDPADPNGAAAVNPVDDHIRLRVDDVLLKAAQPEVDDATFLRRLMLDLTGTLPTPDEVREFVDKTAPEKRRQLIEELFKRVSTKPEEEPQPPPDSAEAP